MLKNYFEFSAKNNFDLGIQMGATFRRQSQERLKRQKIGGWKKKITGAKKFLPPSERHFPHLIEELRGYALGAKINFDDLWAASLEDDLDGDRCTSVITDNGKLMAHSEDFSRARNDITIVKKTLGSLTILEIFYFNTLGGNAVSVNSNGFFILTNSLYSKDSRIGVPKNVIARWLSETKNPEKDFAALQKIKRSSAYNYNIVGSNGKILNIETTARHAALTFPTAPFVHANHYLSNLKKFDAYKKQSSFCRYDFAAKHTREKMSLNEIKYLLADTSAGKIASIHNQDTVANIIFDAEKKCAYVWLFRENKQGFVKFNLDFLPRS